jgi:hypothetical protein
VHDKRPSGSGALDDLENADLVILADKGYQGSTWAKVPYKGRNKPEPQLRAPASEQTRSSRRGNSPQAALLPLARRELAKAIYVLQLHEAYVRAGRRVRPGGGRKSAHPAEGGTVTSTG